MEQLQPNLVILKDKPFIDHLHAIAEAVEQVLKDILPNPSTRLHEAMAYSVLGGGKRLRAFLVWESSQLFGVPSLQALKAAAAVELVHAYSLVHDDLPCMDNAALRRGKPSCHKAFGEATATLVGDALIPLAFQILSSLEINSDIRLELINELAKTIGSQGLVAGQMMDLGQEGVRGSYEELLEQQRLKTGELFGFSAEMGAILGKATFAEREALKSYGLLLGEAFQMVDDWLDDYGHDIGKPLGQDALKPTFLSLLGPKKLYQGAEEAIFDALQALCLFGDKACYLKEAALFTLSRVK